MGKICLVRHGETDWNATGRLQGREDIPLNDRGRAQARQSGEFLRRFSWDMLITSPMRRAKETAEIIRIALNQQVPLVEMDAFVERDYGEGAGLTSEERNRQYPDRVYPGQESWEDLRKRAMDGIERIQKAYLAENVLLVAHGGVINAILATLSGGEIGTGKTRLHNACISHIHFVEEAWQVLDYNQVSHLSDAP
ncbi:histidine phosphatase family protein [Alicyclobacillus fodiniaquatilis]|uniref:Histidine phosphatase family protein n=1 Tax=Alicyclobacillus fodiniaquatilis TaxID=1661150 RepID=A0ABW4JCG4_9BACL